MARLLGANILILAGVAAVGGTADANVGFRVAASPERSSAPGFVASERRDEDRRWMLAPLAASYEADDPDLSEKLRFKLRGRRIKMRMPLNLH